MLIRLRDESGFDPRWVQALEARMRPGALSRCSGVLLDRISRHLPYVYYRWSSIGGALELEGDLERVFGRDLDPADGTGLPWDPFLDHESLRDLEATRARVEECGGTAECTYRVSVADGDEVVVTDVAHRLEDGTVEGVVLCDVDPDLSDARRAHEEAARALAAARERLIRQERLVAAGELMASVAHELNNPLTSIAGFAQLALSDLTASELRDVREPLATHLERIEGTARRCSGIVRNLLRLSRDEGLETVWHDLNDSLDIVREVLAHQLRLDEVRLVVERDPDVPRLEIVPQHVEMMLLNLLNNSMQAIRRGAGHGTIRLSTRLDGDAVEVSVEDDGPGVPPELGQKIFEPLFTTKPEGEGTGLGLSLCKTIADRHGATIQLTSPVPRNGARARGARFAVRFPLPAESDGPAVGLGKAEAPTHPIAG